MYEVIVEEAGQLSGIIQEVLREAMEREGGNQNFKGLVSDSKGSGFCPG